LLDASGQVIHSLPTNLETEFMSQQLDPIDTIATKAFEGYVVRKDLVRKFKGQYPVPTYVAEFLLGRYCASVDEEEIAEGLKIVERQLGEKTIRAGEHELFKARAKEKGHVKLIDIITARLDAGSDSFVATLPSLQLKDVRISEAMVHGNERMLTGGFYAEVELAYDPTIAQEKNGRPFGIDSLREIQLSKREVLPALYRGPRGLCHGGMEGLPDPQHRHGAGTTHAPRPRHDAAAHGAVRRAQLQPGGAGAARHRQEPPVPAGLALCPPDLGRQGDGRAHVRQQRQTVSAAWSASTTWSASMRSPASPSTRRMA
jgi:hypothetical protein